MWRVLKALIPQLRFGSTPLQPRMPPLSDLMITVKKKEQEGDQGVVVSCELTLSSSTFDRVPSCKHNRLGLLRGWSTWADQSQRLLLPDVELLSLQTRIKSVDSKHTKGLEWLVEGTMNKTIPKRKVKQNWMPSLTSWSCQCSLGALRNPRQARAQWMLQLRGRSIPERGFQPELGAVLATTKACVDEQWWWHIFEF